MSQWISSSPVWARTLQHAGQRLLRNTNGGVQRRPEWRTTRNSTTQSGAGQQNNAKLPLQNKNETIQRTMTGEATPVPGLDHHGIPGLRIRDYEALFSESKSNRKQYPYRWDWHLRMTISALGPTAMLFVCTLAIDYFIMTDPDVKDILRDYRIVEKEMRDTPKKVEGLQETIEDRMQSFELQFKVLKDLIAEMEEKIRRREEEDKRRQELEAKQKSEKKVAESVDTSGKVVASKSVSNPGSEAKNSDAMTYSKKEKSP